MSKPKEKSSNDPRLKRLRKRAEKFLEKSQQVVATRPGGDVQNLIHELRVHQAELEMQNEELRRVQAELENSRDRYFRLYDHSPVGYLTLDADGVVHESNLTIARMLGLNRLRLLKKKLDRFVAAESQDDFYRHRQQVFTAPLMQSCELEMIRPDGTTFTGRLESIMETGETAQPSRALVALSDVTLHRQAEKALRESQAQLAGIIHSAMDAIITVNSRQRIVLCNEAGDRMFGHAAGELIGRPLRDLIPEAYRTAPAGTIRGFGETTMTDLRLGAPGQIFGRRRNGRAFPVEASISHIERGGEEFFTFILRDITERLQGEESIRREKQFSENLIDTAPVIVLVLDPKGRIVQFNRYLSELSGHRLDEVRGKDWFATFLPKSDHKRIRKVFASAIEGTRTSGIINSIVTTDGRLRQIEWFDTLLRAADGSTSALLAIGQDVTERLETEGALRQREAELADFFSESPVGLLWVGADGRILRVNRAQLEVLGRAEKEVCGRPVAEFYADPNVAALMLDRLLKKEVLNNQRALLRHKNGSLRHVLLTANGLWQKGSLVHSRWFVRDMTRQKELEREILKISELEQQRLGQELHDDICQQLTAIEYFAFSLEQELSAKSKTGSRSAAEIARMVRNANTTTRKLSHGLAAAQLAVDGFVEALEELALRTRQAFHIDCRVSCPIPVTIGDPEVRLHLFRIVQEAVGNAVKHGRAKRIDIRLEAKGDQIVLSVRDYGTGLPAIAERPKGLGLQLMEYRAGLIFASLAVQREASGGTSVVCSVPRSSANPKGGKKKSA